MEKQPCPTCGREFQRLWQHKCPNASGATNHGKTTTSKNTPEKQPCPTCGREFQRLWQHKCPNAESDQSKEPPGHRKSTVATSTSDKQPCPTCGREFERLWQHKCPNAPSDYSQGKPRPATGESAPKKQPCPTCGREFERIWQHKCPNAVSDLSNKTKQSKTPDKQPCPACGREFERLWQHRCSALIEGKTDREEKQPCPSCGREFVRLWQHKCPNAASASSQEITAHRKSTPRNSTPQKQQCPTCDREFERLWQHKCPNAASDSSQGKSQATARNNAPEKQPCPTCGREFERLWQHKCRAVREENADRKEKQHCPNCGREFVRLWQHKCTAAGPTSSSSDSGICSLEGSPFHFSEGHFPTQGNVAGCLGEEMNSAGSTGIWADEGTGTTHQGARPKVRLTPAPESSHDGKDVCHGCGKAFKRLYQHKCNGAKNLKPSTFSPSPSEDSKGYKPVIDTKSLEELAQRVMDSLGLQASGDPNSEFVAFFTDEVVVKQKDKNIGFDAFNSFRDKIQEELDEEFAGSLQWDYMNAGSSYDGTKVTRADEFDVMFFPRLPTDQFHISCDGAPFGFCFVELTSSAPHDKDLHGLFVSQMCGNQRRLSSEAFRNKVCKAFMDPEAKPGGASFPVLVAAFPRSSGKAGQGHRELSIDLVPALKLSGLPVGAARNLKHVPKDSVDSISKAGFHVIPKQCPYAGYDRVSHLLWRFSFSSAEKVLTKFADCRPHSAAGPDEGGHTSPPTYRKDILRALKRLLEIFKGLDNSRTRNSKAEQLRKAVDFLKQKGGFGDLKIEKFSTFQVRTLMWTEFYVTCPDDALWGVNSRRTRFIHSLVQMKKMVSGRMRVPHFFLPQLDLMAEVPKKEREFLFVMFHIAKELF